MKSQVISPTTRSSIAKSFLVLLAVSFAGEGCEPAVQSGEGMTSSTATALADEQELLTATEEPAEGELIAFSGSQHFVDPADSLVAPTFDVDPGGKPTAPAEPDDGEMEPETQPSARERLLTKVQGYPPEQMVEIMFKIQPANFAWHQLRKKKYSAPSARGAAMEVRRKQMEAHTANVRAKLVARGARNVEYFLASASIAAEVPAAAIAEIASWPEVQALAGDEQLVGRPERAYGGHEARAGMRVTDFEAGGIDASTGGRAGGRVRVGLVEGLAVSNNHIGFLSRPGPIWPSSCFVSTLDCASANTCSAWSPPVTDNFDHATEMARTINGYYASGTNARQMSGIIPNGGADLYFCGYVAPNVSTGGTLAEMQLRASAFVRAVDHAILDQVDVLNVSQTFSGVYETDNLGNHYWNGCCAPCDRACDCAGMNNALSSAAQAGVLVVKSAGNLGMYTRDQPTTKKCLATYPASHSDTLTAGGLSSIPESLNYDTATIYDGASISNYGPSVEAGSSRGGMGVKLAGSAVVSSQAASVIDLVSPAEWSFLYKGYSDVVETPPGSLSVVDEGTSYSAAAVSGVAALLRSGAKSISSSYDWSGRALLASMLLLGDGYQAEVGGFGRTGFDKRSGAGRVHAHYPSQSSLGSVSGWGVISDSISQGQSKDWYAISPRYTASDVAQITQLKVALVFPEPDYQNAADLNLSVYWACAGTGQGTVLLADTSKDIRSRITLKPSEVSSQYADMRCWGLKVSGDVVPGGAARQFTLAYYYHNQNPYNH